MLQNFSLSESSKLPLIIEADMFFLYFQDVQPKKRSFNMTGQTFPEHLKPHRRACPFTKPQGCITFQNLPYETVPEGKWKWMQEMAPGEVVTMLTFAEEQKLVEHIKYMA